MSIADKIQRLQTAKENIAAAITAKGGSVAPGDGFEDYDEDIATIPTGIEDIATEAEMNAKLTPANAGLMFHYTGPTTSSFINGRHYKVFYKNPITIELSLPGKPYGYQASSVLPLDPSLYLGPYESTIYGIKATSYAKIKVKNTTQLVLWINSYAEGAYAYTIASKVDAPSIPYSRISSTVKQHTSSYQKDPRNGLNTSNWRKIVYTTADGLTADDTEHFIYVLFLKMRSLSQNDDRGYFVVEAQTELRYDEYLNPDGAVTIDGTQSIDVRQYNSAQVVEPHLLASNIKKDVDILGVVGTLDIDNGVGYNVNVYQILDATDGITCTLNEDDATAFEIMPVDGATYWNSIKGITTIRFNCSGGHWGTPSDSYARWKYKGTSNWSYLNNGEVLELEGDIDLEIKSGTCLSKGTLISMADGTKKPIEDVVVGDVVIGYDGTCQTVYRSEHGSKSVRIDKDRWVFEGGYEIITTHRHEFYNIDHQKMMYLQDWTIGEHAYTETHQHVALLAHIHEEEPCRYFSIWCDNENYFAGGLLAGNRFTPKIKID